MVDTGAVIAYRQGHIRAIGQVGITVGKGRIGADPYIAALGQRIAGVDHQVEHGAFELDRVDQGDRRFRGQFQFQGDALADGAHQQFLERTHMLVDVHGPGVEGLLTREGEQAMSQGGGAHGRTQGRFGVELNLVGARGRDAFLDQLQAGDDAGEQIVEVMGDAARQLAQGIHLLHLQQLGFGACAFGDFLGQLGGGVVQPGQVRAFAVPVFGDILDEHQAQFRCAVGRNLPLGVAHFALDPHGQGAFPALAIGQAQAQFVDDRLLVFGKALAQGVRVAIVLDHLREGMVAFVNFQLGVQHGDGRRHVDKDFPEPRLAVTQGVFGFPHAQQGAQGGQQHVRVHRVDQVGIGAGVQAGDDVPGLDRSRRHVNHRQQRGSRLGAQFAHDVEAAHVRQVDVEDQRVDVDAVDQHQAFAAGAGFQHLVAVAFQAPAQGVAGRDIVVDDQQADVTFHRRAPWRWPAG
ncbi:hypothetical protein D3C87_1274870 [compost metagenome]